MTAGATVLKDQARHDNEADAYRAIRAIIDRYDELLLIDPACEVEGFHLIEHILLRPAAEGDPLMDVCLDPSCEACGDEDPYSFRVTVALPYWPERFRVTQFRDFLERALRTEAPAHVHVRVCWVSNEQMAELDAAYGAWLVARQALADGMGTPRRTLRAIRSCACYPSWAH
jgi:hypothetical protein